jgi:translation elongation factor EF-Tu-like GTPase
MSARAVRDPDRVTAQEPAARLSCQVQLARRVAVDRPQTFKVTTMEEKIGIVTDYLNRLGVAIIRLAVGDLHVGDHVRIAGRTTEVTQTVESLQVEHHAVEQALRGSEVALKVPERVRRHDEVLLVREP